MRKAQVYVDSHKITSSIIAPIRLPEAQSPAAPQGGQDTREMLAYERAKVRFDAHKITKR